MVYQGPSRGCEICRKRRVKCDGARPACSNCVRRQQICTGYRDAFDVVLKDQTSSFPEKMRKKIAQAKRYKKASAIVFSTIDDDQSTSSNSSDDDDRKIVVNFPLPPDRELEALCFFFANYVTVFRDPDTHRGFLEYLLPIYSEAPRQSPLSLATAAVATNLLAMWKYRGADNPFPRAFYARAVTGTKAALADPVESQSDNLLAAVLLLEFYDNLSRRFTNQAPSERHHDGAVALIKHRGEGNYKNEVSKRLLIAVRNRLIGAALQGRGKLEWDGIVLEDHESLPTNPAIELDRISAAFTHLQTVASHVASIRVLSTHVDASYGRETTFEREEPLIRQLLQQSARLESQLAEWYRTMPEDWNPAMVAVSELHPSIVAAGIYGGHCDVYIHCTVASVINTYRCTRILALQLLGKCQRVLDEQYHLVPETYIHGEIQNLVDGICASVPFHLGNRVKPSGPDDEAEVEYPSHPSTSKTFSSLFLGTDFHPLSLQISQREHMRVAAAMGGSFMLNTFLIILKAARPHPSLSPQGPPQLSLRQGQMQWILGQLRRLQRIYLIPVPSSATAL